MEITNFTIAKNLQVVTLPTNITVTHALILLHGRGASAESIMHITQRLIVPEGCLVIAPQAPEHTWYPQRFIEPQERNEPKLNQSLATLTDVCAYLDKEYSLTPEQITLAGFSQGACLVAEFLKRSPKRFNAAAIWSGGLIGTDQEVATDVAGTFDSLPVYLGCDAADPHIPKERVLQTAHYFKDHGAEVSLALYKELGHTIHPDGVRFINEYLG